MRLRRPRTIWRGRAGSMLAAAMVLLLATVALASSSGNTTLTQTIQDLDRDNRLEPAPGEAYVVRTELGQARAGRENRRVAKLFFGQFTDSHIVDEESPNRVEFLDKFGPPLTSA